MSKLISTLSMSVALAVGMTGFAHAAKTPSLIDTLSHCDATYFDALAKVPAVAPYLTPETKKGERRYIAIKNVPLEEIKFKDPVKIDGLTVTGLVFHDQIVHYEGMPDMHQHIWGLLVQDPWDRIMSSLKLPWEAVDANHKDAYLPWMQRTNGDKKWVAYRRPHDRQVPDLSTTEKTFHAIAYKDQSALVCMMMSAGRPDDAIIEETRPDLFHTDKEPFVYNPPDDAVRNPDANNPHKGM